ncbi:MAG: four helix bundle protein [Verrucomicrobia bacterium]|nr:four helix bundle protein [Verrucomicrobiota bacterium]
MNGKARSNFEQLRIYRIAEALADRVWEVACTWDSFSKATMGKQLVRAADSVGANIAEGEGRGSLADNRRFVRTARGSLNETKHFLRRAYKRVLLNPERIAILSSLTQALGPMLNAYLKSIGMHGSPTARTSDRDTGDDGQPRTTDH